MCSTLECPRIFAKKRQGHRSIDPLIVRTPNVGRGQRMKHHRRHRRHRSYRLDQRLCMVQDFAVTSENRRWDAKMLSANQCDRLTNLLQCAVQLKRQMCLALHKISMLQIAGENYNLGAPATQGCQLQCLQGPCAKTSCDKMKLAAAAATKGAGIGCICGIL